MRSLRIERTFALVLMVYVSYPVSGTIIGTRKAVRKNLEPTQKKICKFTQHVITVSYVNSLNVMLKYDVKSKKSWKLLQCKSKSNVNHESNGNVEHGNSNLMNFYPCSASCKFLFNVNHISNVFLPNVDFKTTRTKNSYIWFSFYRSHTSLAHCLSLDLNKLML